MSGVDHVFHAAALKQVPSAASSSRMQAVLTNVNGSDNVIRAAERAGVASVVCLSTDKAVYPINAMGMSKAMMEKVAQAHARNRGADGPRCLDHALRQRDVQPRLGDPAVRRADHVRAAALTVTDPAMTRFLMSLEDSVDLVEHAFDHAEPGDLFVRKAPACTVAGPRARRRRPVRRRGSGDPVHRHPARREALRVAAQPRGAAEGRGPGRLLPGARSTRGPRVRARSSTRASSTSSTRRLHLAQHRAAGRRGGQGPAADAARDPARAGAGRRRPRRPS